MKTHKTIILVTCPVLTSRISRLSRVRLPNPFFFFFYFDYVPNRPCPSNTPDVWALVWAALVNKSPAFVWIAGSCLTRLYSCVPSDVIWLTNACMRGRVHKSFLLLTQRFSFLFIYKCVCAIGHFTCNCSLHLEKRWGPPGHVIRMAASPCCVCPVPVPLPLPVPPPVPDLAQFPDQFFFLLFRGWF